LRRFANTVCCQFTNVQIRVLASAAARLLIRNSLSIRQYSTRRGLFTPETAMHDGRPVSIVLRAIVQALYPNGSICYSISPRK